jgi:lambda repressor-like predicted transcriptional regulator
MPELLKHEVMSWHLASVKAQIKQAGYIIKKASSKKVSNTINQDDLNLLKELGIEI